jgi:hypothetical protein
VDGAQLPGAHRYPRALRLAGRAVAGWVSGRRAAFRRVPGSIGVPA